MFVKTAKTECLLNSLQNKKALQTWLVSVQMALQINEQLNGITN